MGIVEWNSTGKKTIYTLKYMNLKSNKNDIFIFFLKKSQNHLAR